ncbi:substrate-binding domain-containing protein [Burkholderia plantarii]|uniref:substrate-binding domain-containing protein n=1 Tax=Burkholderia plantarii TaxID=41899 RepID=UPI002729D933|nr:substrate-binding domain-containing protein [Burkholderia plantarii]WLE63275.1 substrate-binding domain-containing protein [Burkholderia plantarii]
MKSSKRKICQVLALVVTGLGATAAMAAGPVVQGGGSSLVAPTIQAEIANFSTSVGAFTYFSVGSGAGQNAFLNNQPTFFGAGVTGTVDFANSDAALLASQGSGYTLAGSSGPLIQIPYIVTAITIPVVNNGQTITSTTTPQTTPGQSHSIALNDNDLCGVFSGKLTNWNQVTNPETGSAYSTSAPIKVVYRTDGSGTTELLTRHLSQVCSTGTGGNSNVSFVDSLTFTDSFHGAALPSNFTGASGSGGVRAAITNASGATVAYLSPDYTNTFLAPSSSVTTSAGAAQLQVASLVNAQDGVYYAPTYQNATTAIGTVAAPAGQQATNPLNWVPAAGNPTSGYPVAGTSQIIVSQCYKDPNVTSAVSIFLSTHYTNSGFAAIIHGNGFDTVPSSYLSAIQSDFLGSGNSLNLNIGNGNVCTGSVAGR